MGGKLRNMTSTYISSNNKMLLLYRVGSKVVRPSWCGIGGHFETDELNDPRACALRELKEEINLNESDLLNLRLKYITLRLKNGEVRQNYYFFADLNPKSTVELTCDEGTPAWVDYDTLLQKEMPHSAKYVLSHYLEMGKETDAMYAGAATKDAVLFTELKEF